MRILLTANASYLPPRGGATRSNLIWLEHLAERGHTCCVVSSSLSDAREKRGQIDEEQLRLTWSPLPQEDGIEAFRKGEFTVYSAPDRARQLTLLRRQIREFSPDWVLVSSEDIGHVLLRAASQAAPGRIVYLAHTPQFYPFGPASWNPDPEATALVACAVGIVAIGHHMAEYIRRSTGRNAAVIHPAIYGAGPFENLARHDDGLITLINPCAVKGLSIFLALADRLPDVAFGALPGWGTTASDRAELQRRPNVTLLPNCRHITQVLSRTRLLLMPSLWYEGFGLSVMEAMLHGIPVISSDSGGLMEAKMGTRFIIPVPGIQRFESSFDERGMPVPVIGAPRIEPWVDAVHALLADKELYEQESTASREAALRFVAGLSPAQLEKFLAALTPAEPAPVEPKPSAIEKLSPEKRALLLQRLRQKNAAKTS